MRVTRRFRTVAGLGFVLAGWGLVTGAPSLLVGAGAIGAWLVVAQVSFLSAIDRTLPGLDVALRPEAERVTAEETTGATLSVSSDTTRGVSLRVTATLPVGVEGTIEPLTVEAATEERRTVVLRWPVAGEFAFDTPEVTFLDRFGLFTQPIAHGESPTVVVEPRAPREIHVGRAGDTVAAGFGNHRTDQTGSGVRPAEVREYVPGDAIRQIDWKATARLADTHVREFEVETDRETKLFVDHRRSMGVGSEGERKLDYARQVALAILAGARSPDEPIGCYTVGDEGLTATFEPDTTHDHANAIRRALLSLAPTTPADATAGPGTGTFSPAVARRRAGRLADTDAESAFAATLRPYLADQTQYVRRVQARPLFDAVTTFGAGRRQTAWAVLVTDDTDRAELRETVKLARRLNTTISVYLTPTVLFEEGALTDLETAYDRYVAFESFRHELDTLAGVAALEVGPADRLSAILDAGRADTRGVEM